MSRSCQQELCDYVRHKPSAVLGNRFFDSRLVINVDVALKADKFEQKIFIISKFRLFFLSGKSTASLKIDKSFHVLTVKAIHVLKEDELAITYDDGGHKKRITVKSSIQTASYVAKQILSALKHYFPDIGNQLKCCIELLPAVFYSDFATLPIDVSPRPCHSYRRTYAALCDFYEQPYRDEVSWDVEKIYTVNKVRELRIEDFSHLLPRDLLPIIGVLQYSTYFTGLVADGVRIPTDAIEVILNVVRRSQTLSKLQLRNCALPKDFVTLLSSAIQHSNNIVLEHIDLSKNPIDDKKGFGAFATVLPKVSTIRSINFSDCQLTEKSVNSLCTGLYNGITTGKAGSMQLTELVLSYNTLKDDVASLINLISLCTSLRVLDLTDTGFPLEKVWAAMKYGGLQIEKLLFGGCSISKKLEGVQAVKEYFSMAVNLTHVSFNNTQLPADFLKAVLLGLASNQQVKPFRLDLDATCDKTCAGVLDLCLAGVRCQSISLRDNNFEAELQNVIQALATIPTLRRLDVGGSNMTSLKRSSKQIHATTVNKILLDLVKLYSEDGELEELVISDCRLGGFLSVMLNALGATTTLKSLDISSNDMGNFGTRILSKALQVNVSLRAINIDNNHIGSEGFVDLANSLKMNHTLLSMPYPVHDAFECMQKTDRPRAIHALSQIQNHLYRNRTSASFDQANSKRMAGDTILQPLMDKVREDIASSVTESMVAFSAEEFPARLGDMVEDFVDQMRREASLCITESLARLGPLPVNSTTAEADSKRSEQVAATRLGELWTEQAKHVYSEWRWRDFCDRAEIILRNAEHTTGTASVGTNSPAMSSSPFTPRKIQAGHRPRSIVGDFGSSSVSIITDGADCGVNMDLPPKPSNLLHLQKAKPRRRGASKPQTIGENEEMVVSRSTDAGDDDVESSDESAAAPTKKQIPGRIAMIPDASLIASVQLRAPSDRERPPSVTKECSSPTLSSDSPPPPLPQRNRSTPGTPPCLPPKPEPRSRVAAAPSPTQPTPPSAIPPTVEDDENANSRRSVADMARLFNKFN